VGVAQLLARDSESSRDLGRRLAAAEYLYWLGDPRTGGGWHL